MYMYREIRKSQKSSLILQCLRKCSIILPDRLRFRKSNPQILSPASPHGCLTAIEKVMPPEYPDPS